MRTHTIVQFCCCTASMEQATDGDQTAAIDGLISSWSENICFILSTDTRIRIDSVMYLRSSSRGRNTNASVTVAVTVQVRFTKWPLNVSFWDRYLPEQLGRMTNGQRYEQHRLKRWSRYSTADCVVLTDKSTDRNVEWADPAGCVHGTVQMFDKLRIENSDTPEWHRDEAVLQ